MVENPYSYITFPLLIKLLGEANSSINNSNYFNDPCIIEAKEKIEKALAVL